MGNLFPELYTLRNPKLSFGKLVTHSWSPKADWTKAQEEPLFQFNFFSFETGSFYIALAVLELIMYTRLSSISQKSSCLCPLLSALCLCVLGYKECTTT